jgi:hypothetical protein
MSFSWCRQFEFQASYGGGHLGQCASTIVPGQTFNVAVEVSSVWTTSTSTALTASLMFAAQVNGWNIAGIPVQTSVSSSTPSATNPSSTTSQSPTNPSSTIPPSPTTLSSTTSQSPPLPGFSTASLPSKQDRTGVNIGIGVSVSLAILGLASAAFAVWYVRKTKSRAKKIGSNNPWEGMAAGPGSVQLGQVHLHQQMEVSRENSMVSRYEMDERGNRGRFGELP